MEPRSLLTKTLFAAALSVSVSACAVFSDDLVVVDGDENAAPIEALAGKTDQVTLPLTPLEDPDLEIPTPEPVRRIFRSASEYRRYFGHDAPGVDFRREWVAYYSAGMQTTDGHRATILSVDYSKEDRHLDVVTAFESPGPGCETHALPELPHALVTFPAPSPKAQTVRFYREESLRDCTSPTPPPTPIAADCAAREGGAMITIENVGSAEERFTHWTTDPVFIDEAKRLLAAGEQRVPLYTVLPGTDCDGQWSYHLETIEWADVTIEVCDAIPSYIQAHLGEWLAAKLSWCPWGARVIRVDDRRPTPPAAP